MNVSAGCDCKWFHTICITFDWVEESLLVIKSFWSCNDCFILRQTPVILHKKWIKILLNKRKSTLDSSLHKYTTNKISTCRWWWCVWFPPCHTIQIVKLTRRSTVIPTIVTMGFVTIPDNDDFYKLPLICCLSLINLIPRSVYYDNNYFE